MREEENKMSYETASNQSGFDESISDLKGVNLEEALNRFNHQTPRQWLYAFVCKWVARRQER